MISTDQITVLLLRWSEGDEHALDDLVPFVYDDLDRMARFQLRNERTGHTLQTKALVHEAYIKLKAGRRPKVQWNNRLHFLAVAARAMRQILVDYARKRNRKKGPGKYLVLPMDEVLEFTPEKSPFLLAINEALEKLGQQDSRRARVVELRIFGGLNNREVAEVLGTSESTVGRDWDMALAKIGGMIRNGKRHDRRPTPAG